MGGGNPPWNKLTSQEIDYVLSAAREMPELSCRQLAAWTTDNQGFSVSESTVYRILRREALVKRAEMQLAAGKGEGSQTMRIPFGQGRAAAIAGIIIMALMIEGAIAVVIDDAWLWGLLALFIVCLFSERRGRLPWQERWWWKEFFGTKESNSSDK